MLVSQKLAQKAKDLYAKSLVALEEGNREEAIQLKADADQALEDSKIAKASEDQAKALNVATLPVELPQTEAPKAEKAVEGLNNTQKAFYKSQFGEQEAATAQILTELHGPDYQWKRVAQWKAFGAYLRGRENALTAPERATLKELILTPEYVVKAIQEGWDVGGLKTTMVEAVDILGGNLVPVDFQTRVLERLPGQTIVRGRAQMESTSRDRVQFPKILGGDTQYTSGMRETWVDETPTSTASETNFTIGMESVPIHTAMALVPLSKNLLEDTAFNLTAYVTRKFAEAAAVNEDNTFLLGVGAGKPQGFLPGGANTQGFQAVNSGAPATLTFDGLIGLMFGIASQYRSNATWIASRATYEAIAKLQDSEGVYYWTEVRGNNAVGAPSTLRGFPVLEQEIMPAIAAGTYPILFGDPKAYMIIDRIGMSITRYDVNPGENLVKFEMKRRLGGQVVEPWRMATQFIGV
jgi:HK97 family phage major capsid protein